MTLVMVAGLIYSALVLGTFAKYYYYYQIRDSNLLLCPVMPFIVFVMIPISMTLDILKYQSTSPWLKLFYMLAIFIFSMVSYPISIGISAMYITMHKDDCNDSMETSSHHPTAEHWSNVFELYDFFIYRLSENINHLHRRLA